MRQQSAPPVAELGPDVDPFVLRHEAADEVHIAAEAIQFSDSLVGSLLPRGSQCGPELPPAVERVRALACLDLYKLAGDLETFSFSKVTEGLPLRRICYVQSRFVRSPCAITVARG